MIGGWGRLHYRVTLPFSPPHPEVDRLKKHSNILHIILKNMFLYRISSRNSPGAFWIFNILGWGVFRGGAFLEGGPFDFFIKFTNNFILFLVF